MITELTTMELSEVKAVLAFAEKSIHIKTGRKLKLYYEEKDVKEMPGPEVIMRAIVHRLGMSMIDV